ncbi:MAG: hypothetical protein SPG61_02770 [Arcanobacterium sp.]|nr:hypothetical protein [Arcanobacterium sp.]
MQKFSVRTRWFFASCGISLFLLGLIYVFDQGALFGLVFTTLPAQLLYGLLALTLLAVYGLVCSYVIDYPKNFPGWVRGINTAIVSLLGILALGYFGLALIFTSTSLTDSGKRFTDGEQKIVETVSGFPDPVYYYHYQHSWLFFEKESFADEATYTPPEN